MSLFADAFFQSKPIKVLSPYLSSPLFLTCALHIAQVLFFSFAVGALVSGLSLYPFIMTGLGIVWGTILPLIFHACCYYLDTRFFNNVLYKGETLDQVLKKNLMMSLFLNGICPILGPALGLLAFVGRIKLLANVPHAGRIMYAVLALVTTACSCLLAFIAHKSGHVCIDPLDLFIGATCLFGQAILPLQGFLGMIKSQNIPSFFRRIIEFIRPSLKGRPYISAPDLGAVCGFISPFIHRVSSFIFRSYQTRGPKQEDKAPRRDPRPAP